MKRRYLYCLLLSSLVIIAIVSNLNKIELGLGLISTYRKNNEIPIVENPLEKLVESEDSVDIIERIEDKPILKKDKNNYNENIENLIREKLIRLRENTSTPANSDELKNKIPFNSIITEYTQRFKSFEAQFEDELSILIETALNDYNSGEYSKSNLADKYLDATASLEVTYDNKFYTLLKEFENKLKENLYDTSIVNEVENYYISTKEQKKIELINKGMELVMR